VRAAASAAAALSVALEVERTGGRERAVGNYTDEEVIR
jgi:hypothetical protein